MTPGPGKARVPGPAAFSAVLLSALLPSPCSAHAVSAAPGEAIVLEGRSAWRVLHSWNVPMAKTPDGHAPVLPVDRRGRRRKGSTFRYMTRYPPAGWTAVDFDDSTWCRRRFLVAYANGEEDLRAGGGGASPKLRQLSLRGKFTVTDPGATKSLRLSVSYRGGLAAYVNGIEVARAHLPPGAIKPGTPAAMYPRRAYLRDDGKGWHWWNDRDRIAREAYPLRVRELRELAVPGRLLRRGTNVLAIEVHAAAFPGECLKAGAVWATCGLVSVRLRANGPGGVVPNVVAPNGLHVWNTNSVAPLHDVEYGDPHERLRAIRLAGARNGTYSGRVVVRGDRPIKGLRAAAGDLAGPGGRTIPASAVAVAYGAFSPYRHSAWGGASPPGEVCYKGLAPRRDDALLAAPPPVVPAVSKEFDRLAAGARRAAGLPSRLPPAAIQPVWLTVRIPADAAPGDYRGTLSIAVEGRPRFRVPIELHVVDWKLPDPADFAYVLGLIQSPDGEALHYGVPFGSERHWELVARSLRLVGRLGAKVLYVPLTDETQYGNAESMAVWVRRADGTYDHDLTRVRRYVDAAVRNMGRPAFVVLGVWNPCRGDRKSPRFSRPLFTVRDGASGKVGNVLGPKHGTEESLAFWRPVLTAVRDLLAPHGLDKSILLGFGGDRLPDRDTVTVFHRILPEASWQATRHHPLAARTLPRDDGEVPVGYQSNVWGGWENHDPDTRRVHGWRYGQMRTWLDRGLWDASPMAEFRTACEQSLLADRRGLGQIGADFWPLRIDGKTTIPTIANKRYPVTHQTNVGIYTGQLLYPGPDGPVPTVRYRMIQENIQECEARIFLEKLLLAEPCRLPGDLAGKVQAVLDERTRWHRMRTVAFASALSWPHSGWEARAVRLYEAAAEASRALSQGPKAATTARDSRSAP